MFTYKRRTRAFFHIAFVVSMLAGTFAPLETALAQPAEQEMPGPSVDRTGVEPQASLSDPRLSRELDEVPIRAAVSC